VKAVLESEGFNVLAAAGGGDALSRARRYSETIHLLITDGDHAGHEGKAGSRPVGADAAGMKVLYISGYSGDVLAGAACWNPILRTCRDPFTPVTLSTKVREILGPER
jgi:hypothetical protein